MAPRSKIASLRKEIVALSRLFYERGWCLATSSNYSVRLDRNHILITTSGKDKGALTAKDIIVMDLSGKTIGHSKSHPSAESSLHCRLFQMNPEIGAVLHTHSKYATLLSLQAQQEVVLEGYEMLKALSGVNTHSHAERIPIFANSQDMALLAATLQNWFEANPHSHAFLLQGHGLYTWGADLFEAKRHVEALEFLFECEYFRAL